MKTALDDTIRLAVKNNLGLEEAITIRPLTIRQLYTFIEDITTGQTPALVAMCADRPVIWVDSLDIDSYSDLARECVKLNFTKATRIACGDPYVAAKMTPLLAEIDKVLALAMTMPYAGGPATSGPDGAKPSPEPSPSASAAATGSAAST